MGADRHLEPVAAPCRLQEATLEAGVVLATRLLQRQVPLTDPLLLAQVGTTLSRHPERALVAVHHLGAQPQVTTRQSGGQHTAAATQSGEQDTAKSSWCRPPVVIGRPSPYRSLSARGHQDPCCPRPASSPSLPCTRLAAPGAMPTLRTPATLTRS